MKYIRWVLALIFLLAGFLKLKDPENTLDILVFFDFFSVQFSSLLVKGIAITELIIGIGLLIQPNGYFLLSATIFTFSFFLISLLGYIDNWEMACGCFGRFSFGKFDLAMVIRNSVLFAVAVLLLRNFKRDIEPVIKTTNIN